MKASTREKLKKLVSDYFPKGAYLQSYVTFYDRPQGMPTHCELKIYHNEHSTEPEVIKFDVYGEKSFKRALSAVVRNQRGKCGESIALLNKQISHMQGIESRWRQLQNKLGDV